tara:strand:- start:227 stop:982 length:756 start_codon:yes stop_codon:yes gene_type:complete
MKLIKIILTFGCIIALYSCADYSLKDGKEKKEKQYFSSNGFALVYDENLYLQKVISKKINNDEIYVMHSLLKKNTPIKIINPINSKVIETKIYKKSNYPKIFNIVISKKISSLLELDLDNPFVEIIEVKKNKTFIAKKTNTFDEERNVAETVPIDEVKMDDLTKVESLSKKKINKENNFIIVVSDFYYEDSANVLMKDLINKTKITNISVKKINDKKYRLFLGPFKNFKALKTSYISLNKLGFDELNVYKE